MAKKKTKVILKPRNTKTAKKAKKPRNRKAQDGTLINIDALKKRIDRMEAKTIAIQEKTAAIKEWFLQLQQRMAGRS